MDKLEGFAQTYIQAPWRKQLQILGLFSLILVLIALVALLYLNVSARAAQAGRQIQKMQEDIEALETHIVMLELDVVELQEKLFATQQATKVLRENCGEPNDS